MKRSLLRTIIISIVATAFGIQGQPAMATECVVEAYQTYLFATQKAMPPYNRKLLFTCTSPSHHSDNVQVRFQADPAHGLSCAGTTSKTSAGPISLRAELFATPGASIWISNGWGIVGFDVLGGKFKINHRRDSLILFDFKVPGQGAAFKRKLKFIKFSKPGGHCSNVLAEAFNWSK